MPLISDDDWEPDEPEQPPYVSSATLAGAWFGATEPSGQVLRAKMLCRESALRTWEAICDSLRRSTR